MNDVINYTFQGTLLGLALGIMPGAVMMFIISYTLRDSLLAGIKVQLGATLLDIIKIGLIAFLFSLLPKNDFIFGSIAIIGGLFLLYMAYQNLTYKPNLELAEQIHHPFWHGALGNILNPASYVFWLSIGGTTIFTAYAINKTAAFGFILGFLLAIFIVSIVIAILINLSKSILSSKGFILAIQFLGIILLFFAVLLFKQGFNYFI